MFLEHFLGKWVPESDQLLGGPPGLPKAPLVNMFGQEPSKNKGQFMLFVEKCVFRLVAPFGNLRAGFCSDSRWDWLCALLGAIWKKHPKSDTGQILEGSGQHFGLGNFLCQQNGPEKDGFVEE